LRDRDLRRPDGTIGIDGSGLETLVDTDCGGEES
jgi:hypothetical protein